jgi:hypothetical protein
MKQAPVTERREGGGRQTEGKPRVEEYRSYIAELWKFIAMFMQRVTFLFQERTNAISIMNIHNYLLGSTKMSEKLHCTTQRQKEGNSENIYSVGRRKVNLFFLSTYIWGILNYFFIRWCALAPALASEEFDNYYDLSHILDRSPTHRKIYLVDMFRPKTVVIRTVSVSVIETCQPNKFAMCW